MLRAEVSDQVREALEEQGIFDWNKIKQPFKQATDGIKNAANEVKGKIQSGIANLQNKGKETVAGAIGGIKQAGEQIVEKVSAPISGVISEVEQQAAALA